MCFEWTRVETAKLRVALCTRPTFLTNAFAFGTDILIAKSGNSEFLVIFSAFTSGSGKYSFVSSWTISCSAGHPSNTWKTYYRPLSVRIHLTCKRLLSINLWALTPSAEYASCLVNLTESSVWYYFRIIYPFKSYLYHPWESRINNILQLILSEWDQPHHWK